MLTLIGMHCEMNYRLTESAKAAIEADEMGVALLSLCRKGEIE